MQTQKGRKSTAWVGTGISSVCAAMCWAWPFWIWLRPEAARSALQARFEVSASFDGSSEVRMLAMAGALPSAISIGVAFALLARYFYKIGYVGAQPGAGRILRSAAIAMLLAAPLFAIGKGFGDRYIASKLEVSQRNAIGNLPLIVVFLCAIAFALWKYSRTMEEVQELRNEVEGFI